jgi:hypothetical protein
MEIKEDANQNLAKEKMTLHKDSPSSRKWSLEEP